jgi:hypothetical protein
MNRRRLFIVVLSGFAAALVLHIVSQNIRQSRCIESTVTAPASGVSAVSRALRPNYPYSVIAGGAYSPAELRFVNERDALVHEHYADFNVKTARLVTLTTDRDQYVSFRLHNRIYWTQNKLRIPRGEILLTDGWNYARTRCGNRLSSTPKANTTAQEPSERLLSLPPFRPELLSGEEIQLTPEAPKGELEQNFPVLPFETPALAAPYIPALAQTIIEEPQAFSGVEKDPAIIPSGLEYVAVAGPNSSGVPGWAIWPATFVSSPSLISEAPEPPSLYLFGFAFCVSSWCLTRMMRSAETSQEQPFERELELSVNS